MSKYQRVKVQFTETSVKSFVYVREEICEQGRMSKRYI